VPVPETVPCPQIALPEAATPTSFLRVAPRPSVRTVAAVAVLATALAAAACGSSSSSPTTTTKAAAPSSTAGSKAAGAADYAWLVSTGVPANTILNTAQNGVVVASRPTQGESPATFFGALATNCKDLQAAVAHARAVPPAPSATLEHAWRSMLDATSTYADDCVTLSHSHSSTDLATWNASLTAMDGANGTLNSVVSAIRTANTTGG